MRVQPYTGRFAQPYIGRFAPSPSGPLHAGSLVAALASWLDARAHQGTWLVRMEDVDTPRTQAGAADHILQQLDALGMRSDGPVLQQSLRGDAYAAALQSLVGRGLAYPCTCTRQAIDARLHSMGMATPRGAQRVYPSTCRPLRGAPVDAPSAPHAWRLRLGRDQGDITIDWHDRCLGAQQQNLTQQVGDFVLQRADGPYAYQLAVVVDDAAQGVTHVVRGADLADNTARQVHLRGLLGLPSPAYLHTPLVLDASGAKLSKANGAPALVIHDAPAAVALLCGAAHVLGLPRIAASTPQAWLADAVKAWPPQALDAARYAAELAIPPEPRGLTP
jgi:glutamyl-Q tRNA(Asp) synthetase